MDIKVSFKTTKKQYSHGGNSVKIPSKTSYFIFRKYALSRKKNKLAYQHSVTKTLCCAFGALDRWFEYYRPDHL